MLDNTNKKTSTTDLDAVIQRLQTQAEAWRKTDTAERITLLQAVKDALLTVAEDWANEAAERKKVQNTPVAGEEWLAGPYAVMASCNSLMQSIADTDAHALKGGFPLRTTTTGQVVLQAVPHSLWDRLLLSGVSADIWMKKGVTTETLQRYQDVDNSAPSVALVLGAGNVAAISPLDCFHMLFTENKVVVLKMNPVNDYLGKYLEIALKPLINKGFLAIAYGGIDVGAYLCEHEGVNSIHITGSAASHDAIVWGVGEEGINNKQQGTPKNNKEITSELGNVSPTIVVPGPWSKADIAFQAEHIATQKMHNAGHNCVALQMLMVSSQWSKTEELLCQVEKNLETAGNRPAYYPNAEARINEAREHSPKQRSTSAANPPCAVLETQSGADNWLETNEVFGPALGIHSLHTADPEAFLRQAIDHANNHLAGTLGANIIIHPKTIEHIGQQQFEALIADLRYGTIAVNAWTGLSFLIPICPWGAFPGHTLDNIQSGIGFVHNSLMLHDVERCVVTAPFKPFPRNLLSLQTSLLGRPPWFITNKQSPMLGKLLTQFQYQPSVFKLPRIFMHALMG